MIVEAPEIINGLMQQVSDKESLLRTQKAEFAIKLRSACHEEWWSGFAAGTLITGGTSIFVIIILFCFNIIHF